jgi:hypothetical protein
VVDADVLDVLLDRIRDSPWGPGHDHAAEILKMLTTHDFGLKLIANSNLCTQLVSLSRRVLFPILDLGADNQTAMTRKRSLWVLNED